jgi:hypothetical protein
MRTKVKFVERFRICGAVGFALMVHAIFGVSGIAAPPVDVSMDTVLARIGETPIRESDFDRYLRGGHLMEDAALIRASSTARALALGDFFDLTVLAAKARRDGIDRDLRFIKARELMEMKTLVQLFQDRHRDALSKQTEASAAEVKEYYDTHTNEFTIPPSFTAWHLLIYVKENPAFPEKGREDSAALAVAQKALAQLQAGTSWAAVVKEFSADAGAQGGLLRNAEFGRFPTEMETALRDQAPGKPGEPVKSSFGYHLLQVESRVGEGEREPLGNVREFIAQRIASDKNAVAQKAYLDPLRSEMKLAETSAAHRDFNLQDGAEAKSDELLATLGGVPIREEDFRWFVKDAYRPEQRQRVLSQPGARQTMVRSYLILRTIEAKARKDGLDHDPVYEATRSVAEMKLLAEFLQERDHTMPWQLPGPTEESRTAAGKAYLDRLRSEMGFKSAHGVVR